MSASQINLEELEQSLERSLAAASIAADLEILKRDWLSREGMLKTLFKQLREVDADQRPAVAARLNVLKERLESFISTREAELGAQKISEKLSSEYLDLSLPSRFAGAGAIHPITFVERKIAAVLRPFGFKSVLGPEVETEYFCFDALNIPKHHPARDMQDTFYTDTGHVLRTHTTSVQARELQKGGLPIKVASFGRAYRNETEDASHQALFHQFELVWIEKGLTLANLMGLISHILKALYGKRRKVRFVPKYYPYTEPSLGPQIDCGFCKGQGCSACGGSGWVTVAGSGMVHGNVLREFNYNPDEVSGFAFGMGTARLASQITGLPALKMLYENDLRILRSVA